MTYIDANGNEYETPVDYYKATGVSEFVAWLPDGSKFCGGWVSSSGTALLARSALTGFWSREWHWMPADEVKRFHNINNMGEG